MVAKDRLRHMNEMLDVNEMLVMTHRWEGQDVLLGKSLLPKTRLFPVCIALEICTTPEGGESLGEFRERLSSLTAY